MGEGSWRSRNIAAFRPFDNFPSSHVLSNFCPAGPSNTWVSTKTLVQPPEVR